MTDEDVELVNEHENAMISNLRMRNEARRLNAFDSERRFLSEAADHAAVATALRAMINEPLK